MERQRRPKAEIVTDEPPRQFVRSVLRIDILPRTWTGKDGVNKDLPAGLLTRIIMKWFDGPDGSIILAGDEEDDHDMWKVEGQSIYLIGVLKAEKFKEVSHFRKGTILNLTCSDFIHYEPGWPGQVFKGKGESAYDLGDRVTGPAFTFAEKA